MNFDPKNFYIGMMEFFSILMPGALLVYLYGPALHQGLVGRPLAADAGVESTVLVFFGSYLVGHLVFLVGSLWVDERLYAPLRTRRSTSVQPQAGTGFFARLADGLAQQMLPRVNDLAQQQVRLIRNHYLAPLGAQEAVNAYQWSKARLMGEDAEGLAEVKRFEADSKFFRSFFVAMLLVLVVKLATLLGAVLPGGEGAGGAALAEMAFCAGVLFLAFWRYADLRLKAVDLAYWLVLHHESERQNGYRLPHFTEQ